MFVQQFKWGSMGLHPCEARNMYRQSQLFEPGLLARDVLLSQYLQARSLLQAQVTPFA